MMEDQLRAHLNPEPVATGRRAATGASWVYLGALIGLILGFGGLLLASWPSP